MHFRWRDPNSSTAINCPDDRAIKLILPVLSLDTSITNLFEQGISMRITFVLPGMSSIPIGGYKVVYQYANHLAAEGHRVTLAHLRDAVVPNNPWRIWTRWRIERQRADDFLRGRSWFAFHPDVRISTIPFPFRFFFPKADATIATSWRTAAPVADLHRSRSGRRHYLLQHIEDWDADRKTVLDTWKLPLHKIVISHWLGEVARSLGEDSTYIPNGLDFDEFSVDIPLEERKQLHVGMLWHDLEWKGSKLGLEALQQAKLAYPDLVAEFFGTGAPPVDLPSWIDYHQCPTRSELRALYNRCAIFMAPSFAEGWALPPAEAIQCGCALLATDIGGHQDYAINGKTASTFPPGDSVAMANALIAILSSPVRRLELANSGNRWIQQFTWIRATDSLVSALTRPSKS